MSTLLFLILAQEVLVTGTYTPIPLEEADRNVRALAVEPIRLTSNTIADLMKLDSSVDLRQRAGNAVQGDISIRGGGFGQTLVLEWSAAERRPERPS